MNTSLYVATAFAVFSVFCAEDNKWFTAGFSFVFCVAYAITVFIPGVTA